MADGTTKISEAPTEAVTPDPKNAKILAQTLTVMSPSQGSSCQAPGLARQ